jgi:hypothetical protein
VFIRSRRRRAAGLLAAFVFASVFSAGAWAKPGDTKRFVILHTNDQHGHLLPFSYPDRVSPEDDVAQMPVRKDIGGIARRATLVKQIRAREKNVFLFDGGDCMDGTPFSTEFFGKADYDAMNGVGYDFAVPGNHDFNMTAQQFASWLALSSSRTCSPTYTIRTGPTNNVRSPRTRSPIGTVCGSPCSALTTYSTRTYKAAAEAYRLRDPLDVAREMIPLLRKQADLVVIVAHVGHEVEWQIAREVPGVDVIVGAHSHKRFPNGVYVAANTPGPNDPPGTVYVQAHQWGGELGRLDLTVAEQPNGRWRVARYGATLLPVTGKYAPDPQVARTVARYWDKIKNKYGVVVGQATGEFTEARGQDYTNYYLVADAVQQTLGTQFDLENRSGVRGPLLTGPVTMATSSAWTRSTTRSSLQNQGFRSEAHPGPLAPVHLGRAALRGPLRGRCCALRQRRRQHGRGSLRLAIDRRHHRRQNHRGRRHLFRRDQLVLFRAQRQARRHRVPGHQTPSPRRADRLHPQKLAHHAPTRRPQQVRRRRPLCPRVADRTQPHRQRAD